MAKAVSTFVLESYFMMRKDVFRTQKNIYDAAFCENN